MEIHQIRYFLALSETLNFTRAAENCHVSQPALTRAIQALEAELGGDLIRREGRHSHLTELGRRMLPLLRRCYDSAMGAKELALAASRNEIIPVRILISHTVCLERIIAPLAELFRAFPKAHLRLSHGGADDITQALREGSVDLAVAGPLAHGWDRVDDWPLWEERFMAALPAGHARSSAPEIAVDDLLALPLVTQAGCESREEIAGWLRRFAREFQTHDVHTQEDVVVAVQAGLGLALMADTVRIPDTLRRVAVSGLTLRRTVSAYAVAGRPRCAPVTALLSLLRARTGFAVAA
jgi:DNA-binding transcriptional LysR family regulator